MGTNSFYFYAVKKCKEERDEAIKDYTFGCWVVFSIILLVLGTFFFLYLVADTRIYPTIPTAVIGLIYLINYNRRIKELKRRNE